MILTAHQPGYLPWLGLFHKIALADLFCVFDIVQYQAKEFDNRNRIKTQSGPLWLSVPVESKDRFQKKLCDIKIIQNGWNRKHVKSLRVNYAKTPFFETYFTPLEEILMKDHVYLADLNVELLKALLGWLGIAVPVVRASDYQFSGVKSDLVLDMCLELKASDYIFGEQGMNYADVPSFKRVGIDVYFQKYVHPVYPQLHGDFLPYMSVIDLLFNAGTQSREILFQGNPSLLPGITKEK